MNQSKGKIIDRLRAMLTYCRPMGSATEREFCSRYLKPVGAVRDVYGNHLVRIGQSRVLWSCHTDTVHARDGRQRVDLNQGWLELPLSSRSSCLGADDTVGVFLMLEMIRAKVPGVYVFHYGEERGAIGSRQLVAAGPHWLNDIDCAIALDRKGTQDVITHQGYRTCSDSFALDLAERLGMDYQPSDQGIFTDTVEYAPVVPECTNLSIGYEHAHSNSERVDTAHVLALRDRLLTLDLTGITIEREPGTDFDDYDEIDVDVWLSPDRAELERQERQDRAWRELQQWFREISDRSRYTKG